MNAEKTLEKLHGIALLLPESEKFIFDHCRKHPHEARKMLDGIGVRIAELMNEAETDVRREAAKQSGNGNRQKAAERIIKSAYSTQPNRPAMHGAWSDADGAQYVFDGYRLFKLFDPLPLPTIPEKETPINAARAIDPAKNNNGATLNLPELADLRAYIKEEKARKKAIKDKTAPVYDFGDALPLVNAQYLLDALELLPGCTATISSRAPLITPIYFESVHGCGVLCPVKKEA